MTQIYVIALFAFCIFDQAKAVSNARLINMKFDMSISHRLAETEITATFQNKRKNESNVGLKLLIPDNAFITSLSVYTKGQNLTSKIIKKRDSEFSKPPETENIIRLKRRRGKAQVLKLNITLEYEEKITLVLKYVEGLERILGHYHAVLYLPSGLDNFDLQANIHVIGELKHLTFLKAMGEEKPLSRIKYGRTRVYAPSSHELKVNYKLSKDIDARFDIFKNPMLSEDQQPTSTFSFKPSSQIPDSFLSDPGLVLFFDIKRSLDGADLMIQNGFFLHYFCPEGLPKLPTHTVFVLDKSGSMSKENRLDNVKIAMKTILQSLKLDDSFEIIAFSTYVKSFGVGFSKDITSNIGKIESLSPSGGTNIHDALREAIDGANKYSQQNGAKQIVFLTDGKVSKTSIIRKMVKKFNTDLLPIYTIAFGDKTNIKFLQHLSRENRGGRVRKIRSKGRPAEQLKSFYQTISAPLLTDVSLKYNKKKVVDGSVFRNGHDNFYSGKEIILVGKLKDGTKEFTVNVNGKGLTGKLEFITSAKNTLIAPVRSIRTGRSVDQIRDYYQELSSPLLTVTERDDSRTDRDSIFSRNSLNGHIQLKVSRNDTLPGPQDEKVSIAEKLWAYLAVQDLLSAQEIEEDNNRRNEQRARAVEIALKYKFVTGLTSLSFDEGLTLVNSEDCTDALVTNMRCTIDPTQIRRFSFVDNDPHFVVQVPGLVLPLCFDLHGQPGNILSLIRDNVSGFIVNGKVSAAIETPGATYFTEIFISLEKLNLTITTSFVTIECIHGDKPKEVLEVWHETKPLESRKRKGAKRRKTRRRHKKRKNRKLIRKIRSVTPSNSSSNRQSIWSNFGFCIKCNQKRFKYFPSQNKVSPVIDVYLEKDSSNELKMLHNRNVGSNFTLANLRDGTYKKEIMNKVDNKYPTRENLLTRRHLFKKETRYHRAYSECQKVIKWEHIAKRRYDNVEITVRGRHHRKRMDVVVGDVNLHIVITNTRKKNSQSFLGFYIQEQNILSRNTTGVIGQFVYKSVETIGHYPKLFTHPESLESKSIPLSVVHQQSSSVPKVNRVTAVVSRRRSILHKERVLCLHVKKHDKGLLAKKLKDYLLPNIDS